jgi:hypothetical protein
MRYSNSKEIHHEVKRLVGMSWKFIRGKKHGKLISPNGTGFLTVPCTPSDCRGYQNFLHDIRRLERMCV